MAVPLHFSEAFAIALHATTIIAAKGEDVLAVADIAEELNCSYAHLQKVMQRLVKSGLLNSIRGPKGGFLLAKKPSEIYFLDIYEAIEGKLEIRNCLFEARVCTRSLCVLGGLTGKINKEVYTYFTKTSLADVI